MDNHMVFTDMFQKKFILSEEDNISCYVQRESITDAINIINYIYKYKKDVTVSVDFGCHMGAVSTALWAVASPTGIVYSIDADPYNIAKSKINLKLKRSRPEIYY